MSPAVLNPAAQRLEAELLVAVTVKRPEHFQHPANDKHQAHSQGQQRRLGVAALLAYRCPLMVCDEPTYAQDRNNVLAIMDELQRRVVQDGLTLIFSTHDRLLAADYADHIYEMKGGQLHEIPQSSL